MTAPDPLRGEPDCPTVQRVTEVAALLRPSDTVPVLAPGELTLDQVRDRAGMAGTVLVLAGLYGAALGLVLAWLGGAL